MNHETLLKIANNLRDLNYTGRISPFGINEPLLDARIVDIVQLFRIKCPKAFLSLNTNGDRLTQDLLEQLFQVGLNALGISIYDDLGMKRLATYAQDSRVALIDMRQPGETLENRGGQVLNHRDRFHPEQVIHTPCYRPFNMLVVRASGNVVVCCADMYGDVVLGNVEKSRLEEIWFSKALNTYRRELLTKGRADLKLCQDYSHSGGTSEVVYPRPHKTLTVGQ